MIRDNGSGLYQIKRIYAKYLDARTSMLFISRVVGRYKFNIGEEFI